MSLDCQQQLFILLHLQLPVLVQVEVLEQLVYLYLSVGDLLIELHVTLSKQLDFFETKSVLLLQLTALLVSLLPEVFVDSVLAVDMHFNAGLLR